MPTVPSRLSGPKLPPRVDVLVVGAGTAGAAVAAHAAEAGLTTLCVERGPLEGAGAHWVNGVPAWVFDEAGIARPTGPELRSDIPGFHMLAGDGPSRIFVGSPGLFDVDMRLLQQRLVQRARDAGATFASGIEVHGERDGEVQTSGGTVHADVVVDASGLRGARLLGSPKVGRRDLCAAAQAVHHVKDRAGALAFLERHGAREGETLSRAGVAGGYSILNATVKGDEVSILTGTIPADGHPSGGALLDDFVASERWIGERVFGGRRAIPLGRAHDVIARGRIAAVGDAARQVFSAHGSGIAAGLVAARMLVRAVSHGRGPEGYAVAWQRRYGGAFAVYDLFRRFSQDLSLAELGALIRRGVLDTASTAPVLVQRMPKLGPAQLVARLPSLAESPRTSARLAKLGARAAAVLALYAAYPTSGSRARWSAAVARACGDARWAGAREAVSSPDLS